MPPSDITLSSDCPDIQLIIEEMYRTIAISVRDFNCNQFRQLDTRLSARLQTLTDRLEGVAGADLIQRVGDLQTLLNTLTDNETGQIAELTNIRNVVNQANTLAEQAVAGNTSARDAITNLTTMVNNFNRSVVTINADLTAINIRLNELAVRSVGVTQAVLEAAFCTMRVTMRDAVISGNNIMRVIFDAGCPPLA
jgi:methyl-accepting chemotaxis protein